MNSLPLNYNTIKREGKKVYLYDEAGFNLGCRYLEELQKAYKKTRELLEGRSLPITEDWILAIAEEGAEGLRRCVIAETEEKVKSLGLPSFVVQSIKKNAPQEIEAEVWSEADSLKMERENAAAYIPFKVSVSYDEAAGVVIDEKAAKVELLKHYQIEVSQEQLATAEIVLSLAKQVRELELLGVNARQLICKYAAENEAPDEARRYNDIVFSRHQPGQLAPLSVTPIAPVFGAKNNS